MDLVKMTCGLTLGHKLSYAVVQCAFRRQICTFVCTTLIFYGGPFAKHRGRIVSFASVISVLDPSTRRSVHGIAGK